MKKWGIIPWAVLFSIFAFSLEGALWFWGILIIVSVCIGLFIRHFNKE